MQNCSLKSIEVSSDLIEINNSRLKIYFRAAEETEGPSIKHLFSQLVETGTNINHEVSTDVKIFVVDEESETG